MSIKVSESVDVDSLSNVDDKLKPTLKEILKLIDIEQEKSNSFTTKQITRIIDDLNNGGLVIKLGKENKKGNEYDKYFAGNPYVYGCYANKNNTFKEIFVKEDLKEKWTHVLNHEFEHFLIDEKPIKDKKTIDDYYKKHTLDFPEKAELHNIRGGFYGDVTNNDWLSVWNEAATEMISANRLGYVDNEYNQNFINFVDGVLHNVDKTFDEFRTAFRQGDLSFIYNLMPMNLLINLSKLNKNLSAYNPEIIGVNSGELNAYLYNKESIEYKLHVMNKRKNENQKIDDKNNIKYGLNNVEEFQNKIGLSEDSEILVQYNLPMFLQKEKEKCNSSDELVEKLEEMYKENEIYEKMFSVPRLQILHLSQIAKAKAMFSEDTEDIDRICSDFENRLIQKEILTVNLNKIEKYRQSSPNKVYEEYKGVTFIESNFEYKKGEKYLNEEFKENNTRTIISEVNSKKGTIKIIEENGYNQKIKTKHYLPIIFNIKANKCKKNAIENRENIVYKENENNRYMQFLFEEGIAPAKDKGSKLSKIEDMVKETYIEENRERDSAVAIKSDKIERGDQGEI